MSSAPAGQRRSGQIPRWVFGLAIGCGGVLVLVGIAFAIGAYWLFGSGPQVASDKILGAESQGYLALPDPAGDAGISELLVTFLEEAQAADGSQGELPGFLRGYEQAQQRQGAANLQMWLPKEATVTFEQPPGAAAPEFLAAVNLRSFPRLVKAFVEGQSEGSLGSYRDHGIHDLGRALVSFHGTTLLVAESRDSLEIGIDRLEDGTSAPPPVAPFVASRLPESDLSGHLPAGSSLLESALGELLETFPAAEEAESREQVSEILGAHFGLDLVDGDSLAAEVTLTCDGPGAAARWAERLSGQRSLDHGLRLASTADAEGEQVRLRLDLRGLRAAMRSVMRVEP